MFADGLRNLSRPELEAIQVAVELELRNRKKSDMRSARKEVLDALHRYQEACSPVDEIVGIALDDDFREVSIYLSQVVGWFENSCFQDNQEEDEE